jgi:hypothetical protein
VPNNVTIRRTKRRTGGATVTSRSVVALLGLAAGQALAGCDGCKTSGANEVAAVLPVSPNQGGEWLRTEQNRILTASGARFHGRGANIQDTRSCDACSFEPPQPAEVMRRVDELVDHWKANFLRLTLESYAKADRRVTWKGALDDDAQLRS